MMLFLSVNIAGNLLDLILSESQHAVSLLPTQFEPWFDLFVNPKGGCAFKLTDEVCKQHRGRETTEHVRAIRHCVVANRPAPAGFHFFVYDLQELWSPDAIN